MIPAIAVSAPTNAVARMTKCRWSATATAPAITAPAATSRMLGSVPLIATQARRATTAPNAPPASATPTK